MKGLKHIPSENNFVLAYKALQSTSPVNLKQLVLWSQWSRLDPRLGEVIVSYIARHWKSINPIELNMELQKQPWPAVFGVLLEQVPFYFLNKGLSFEKKLFSSWKDCSMSKIKKAQNELFFIGLFAPGKKSALNECTLSTKPYRLWGYYGRDIMVNKYEAGKKTIMKTSQREVFINELIKKYKTLTVKKYLEEINYQIHLRQAQRDLQNHPLLKAHGHTKNRFYKKVS